MNIYTIGHSNYKIEYFIELLKLHNINCIADVRSVPFSKYVPQFNRNELKKELLKYNITYVFMGKELGARRENINLYTGNLLDFQKVSKDSLFISGIERILNGLKKKFKITLMCSEKDPIDCHRNILVARELSNKGIKISNIKENGKIETQEQIETRLVNMYFPNHNQINMFSKENEIDNLINRAYNLRNKEIAYNKEKIRA